MLTYTKIYVILSIEVRYEKQGGNKMKNLLAKLNELNIDFR